MHGLLRTSEPKSIFREELAGRSIDEFERYMNRCAPNYINQEFAKCFQTVNEVDPLATFKKLENVCKNRYSNIVCLDNSRVILQNGNYIHANWVDSFEEKNAYICTQGPLSETAKDFWTVIWENNVRVIIMLTDLIERDVIDRCFEYWPVGEYSPEEYGELAIRITDQTISLDAVYTKTTMLVTNMQTQERRTIYHFQYSHWPTLGAPANMHHFIQFYEDVSKFVRRKPGPALIHCSDGVGQSGAFITIDICIRRLRKQEIIDIRRTLELLRKQRSGCIQSARQYMFCHQVLLMEARALRKLQSTGSGGSGGDTIHQTGWGKRVFRKLTLDADRLTNPYERNAPAFLDYYPKLPPAEGMKWDKKKASAKIRRTRVELRQDTSCRRISGASVACCRGGGKPQPIPLSANKPIRTVVNIPMRSVRPQPQTMAEARLHRRNWRQLNIEATSEELK